MTADAPQDPPPPPEAQIPSPEDRSRYRYPHIPLERLLAASETEPHAPPDNRGALRRKVYVAVLIAAVGVGASIMSCVGQSFSYRQARAMEGIEQQLQQIRASCAKGP